MLDLISCAGHHHGHAAHRVDGLLPCRRQLCRLGRAQVEQMDDLREDAQRNLLGKPRTDVETGNTTAVLDGEIDQFIEALTSADQAAMLTAVE